MTRSRSDPFYSPEIRLSRAKSHIDRLDKRVASFFNKEPYASLVEPNATGTHYVHKIKLTRHVPDAFSTIAGEALEGLRSVLDQTGYAVAIAAGNVSPKHTYSPIADNAADLDNVAKGRCKDLPPEIIALFRSYEAHRGGNFPIWALNKLRQSIHTKLIPCAIMTSGLEVRTLTSTGGFRIFSSPIWDSTKNEISYMESPIASKLKYQIRIAPDVAFDEIYEIRSVPAISILRDIYANVKTVLNETRREARRIGILRAK